MIYRYHLPLKKLEKKVYVLNSISDRFSYEYIDYFPVFYVESQQWRNDVLVCPAWLTGP